MKRITVLVLAGWTAAASVNAQVIRFDGEGRGRPNESLRDQLRRHPAPPAPEGRDIQDPRHGGRDDGRGGGRDQGRRGGRQDRMRGFPDRWDGRGVRRLAESIDRDANVLYRDYEQNSRTGNFFEKISRAMGLQLLSELSTAANRYRREVDSRWSDPVETRENYQELVRALDKADDEFFLTYRSGSVREQYRRVSDSIEELIRYYRYHDGDRRDDRHDRDGRGGWGRARCEGVNFWGKWYEGGGCDIHGCWTYGGGCNTWGCWRQGGGCGIHGCVGQVPSQPCVE